MHCYSYLVPNIYDFQHGLLEGKSTVSQLLQLYHDILTNMARGKETDVLYLDLSKAVDKALVKDRKFRYFWVIAAMVLKLSDR